MPYLAYFLTWTTYGAWLHGDERESADDRHNMPGTPYLEPEPARVERMRERMSERPFTLEPEARAIVDHAIRTVARNREWTIHALNVRSNHVHAVVRAPSHTPEIVTKQFKAWSTRALQDAGTGTDRARFWTRMGSTRWVNTETSLHAAIDYVLNHQ